MKDKYYVWFDTEFSSLDLDSTVLLQVAALITDTSLRRVLSQKDDVRLPIRLEPATQLSPWVEENLRDLIAACRSHRAVDINEADERLAEYIDRATGRSVMREDERPVLAGNSIHIDWWLVRRFLPRFLSRLHYRNLDVTALKLEWRQRHPRAREFDKENPKTLRTFFPEAVLSNSENRHDAYYDVQASIAELAFYRRHLMVKPR